MPEKLIAKIIQEMVKVVAQALNMNAVGGHVIPKNRTANLGELMGF
jgi:hypothetical protein